MSFTRVGSFALNSGEDFLDSAVIDTLAGYAYFCASGKVVKINLSTFQRDSALALGTSYGSVIDSAAGYAYFGVGSTVVKVNLSTFIEEDTVILNSGNDNIQTAVIDTIAGSAYFGTANSSGVVTRISLGSKSMRPGTAGSQTLTVNGNLTIGDGTNPAPVTAA